MSTTYLMVVNDVDVEVARTHFNGTKVEVTWLNPLSDLLVDEELVMSDSGAPLCLTIGEIRELQVPSDAEVIMKLRRELVELEKEAFENRLASDKLEDEMNELEHDLEEEISQADKWKADYFDMENYSKSLRSQLNEATIDKDDSASESNHFEEKLQAEIDELKEARKALSNALQESLDREAVLRQDARVNERRHDDTFEDYKEIREMVSGVGSLVDTTHGEFLEVLGNTKDLSDALQRTLNLMRSN